MSADGGNISVGFGEMMLFVGLVRDLNRIAFHLCNQSQFGFQR